MIFVAVAAVMLAVLVYGLGWLHASHVHHEALRRRMGR